MEGVLCMEQANVNVDLGGTQSPSATTSSRIVQSGTFSEMYNSVARNTDTSHPSHRADSHAPCRWVRLPPSPRPRCRPKDDPVRLHFPVFPRSCSGFGYRKNG